MCNALLMKRNLLRRQTAKKKKGKDVTLRRLKMPRLHRLTHKKKRGEEKERNGVLQSTQACPAHVAAPLTEVVPIAPSCSSLLFFNEGRRVREGKERGEDGLNSQR
jgi:hypothetical protein